MAAPTIVDWSELILNIVTVLLASLGAIIAWRTFRADARRERVSRAAGLNAWWVVGRSSPPTTPNAPNDWWGVEISNSAPTPFFEITVRSENRSRFGRAPMPPITLAVLPPGACFARWFPKTDGGPHDWHAASYIPPFDGRPLVFSGNHEVTRIQYCDAAGDGWSWSPTTGIVADAAYARAARARSDRRKTAAPSSSAKL